MRFGLCVCVTVVSPELAARSSIVSIWGILVSKVLARIFGRIDAILPDCARGPSCAPLVVRAMGGLRRRRVRIPRSGLGAGGLGLWTVGLRRARGRRRRGYRRCPWSRRWCWVGAGRSRDVRVFSSVRSAKCRGGMKVAIGVRFRALGFFGLPCVGLS